MADKEKKYLVDFAIRHLWHKISRMYNQQANEHGLTMSIGFILLNIDKEGTPSTQPVYLELSKRWKRKV